ncbi:MAG TPA: hypothetical protein DDY18_09290, partial [Flavobacterium sp.]|nr:hypothetical protein [Flavobacterium sp.]
MNTITNFWNHFQQINFVFLHLNEIPKDELKTHFDILVEILHQYNKHLDLIIKNKKNGVELIITANGNPYLFKEVEFLVRHAPVVERWKITAFLQPETNLSKYENGTDKPLEYYGISLRISDMYFIPLENPNKPTDLGIKVLLKNYIVHKDNPRLREAVYIQIEHLIGEKSFADELAFIEINQLKSVYFKDECVIELYNLKFLIDSY